MKILFWNILVMFFYFSYASIVLAQSGCQTLYGTTTACTQDTSLQLDATTENPRTFIFQTDVTDSNARFHINEPIYYRLVVKNTTDTAMKDVKVTALFPPHVIFVSSPAGEYNGETKTLTTNTDIPANTTKTLFLTAKIVPQIQIGGTYGFICETLRGTASQNGRKIDSETQFCIESGVRSNQTKGGLPINSPMPLKKTPATGSGMTTLPLLGSAMILGYLFRKRSAANH